MLTVTLMRGKYQNIDAPENVLHYLSCDHDRESDRRKCLQFFSPNMVGDPDFMAYSMKLTQQMYKNCGTGWKRIHHLVITLPDKKSMSRSPAFNLAILSARFFSCQGFQTACGVFMNYDTSLYEIHLGISSISAYTGKTLQFNEEYLNYLQELFSWYFSAC